MKAEIKKNENNVHNKEQTQRKNNSVFRPTAMERAIAMAKFPVDERVEVEVRRKKLVGLEEIIKMAGEGHGEKIESRVRGDGVTYFQKMKEKIMGKTIVVYSPLSDEYDMVPLMFGLFPIDYRKATYPLPYVMDLAAERIGAFFDSGKGDSTLLLMAFGPYSQEEYSRLVDLSGEKHFSEVMRITGGIRPAAYHMTMGPMSKNPDKMGLEQYVGMRMLENREKFTAQEIEIHYAGPAGYFSQEPLIPLSYPVFIMAKKDNRPEHLIDPKTGRMLNPGGFFC
ncbi:hypothetical protein COU37_01115 [Candidatus Micrarchaeota archaeon CG10_big_fil_rev_8_21_14_0_10_45_29]|nr:MAG: hypothetical protein COU37_01115 [Candidatus Micrarchaeota archaeon CG10_big_fil_rev_8_21_14_0_10_45_29]